ncbi:uncharacterized protein LOC110690689 isoform X1 [Chenopodium quinoa]|uniref:uncharacterized protein LOC110690689 isoform X1 n=1 Tax=Chenopodium quinoa TaxID=63459 RepID=UPI000B797999|nr:uncharacterized protein LOC110690689 isoform X1 [Chenopodium quinoa]XP_021723251.1 uncharacterized protein LOC110690689 isoform X1 [Chenopodium quinoa]
MMKLKCGSNFFNGVQALNFIHGFHRLRYSTSCSSSTEANPSSSLTNYLVEVLGFSSQQSLSTSTKLAQRPKSAKATNVSTDLCNKASNANLITNFFKQNGFDESQIRKIILVQPRILLSNVDKTLKPKFEFLRGIGISGSVLSRIIALNPTLLCMRLNPVIQTLRQVLGSDENVCKALSSSSIYCRRGTLGTYHKHLLSNAELLKNYGIPYNIIQKHVMQDPESFVVSPLLFKDDLIKAEQKFRISRDSTMFLYVVRILRRLSEKNIESKFQVYKSFGWTQSDFFELIRRIPSCLGYSEAMTKMKLSFFMCELGYQPAYLMSRSAFMTCSLEKRVKPRHQVVLVLKEKGLIKKNYCFYSIIWMNELKFVNNLVLPYVEVHEIYANHVGVNAKLLTQGKANPHFNI